jgi:hypothetical protein
VSRKFQIDVLGDRLCTVAPLIRVESHDWVVDQLVDIFHTTHKVKTVQVVKSRGRYRGDIEVTVYLPNTVVQVSLVLDLITQ